jgi:hypothetical protein
MLKRIITAVLVVGVLVASVAAGLTAAGATAIYGKPPSYKAPPPVWLELWTNKDGSKIYDNGTDFGCFGTSTTGPISPTYLLPDGVTTFFLHTCEVAYPGDSAVNVIEGWVTLPAPGTIECWGQPLNGGVCENDVLLAALNKANGWHLAYGWFFPGYGGH